MPTSPRPTGVEFRPPSAGRPTISVAPDAARTIISMTAPTLDRRGFLAGRARAGTLALTGWPRSGSDKTPAAASVEPPADLSDWNNVRAQFALDPKLAHFEDFVVAAHPQTSCS